MPYISETEKIRPVIKKYLTGRIMDIGCGQDKVSQDAYGIDARKFPHTDFVTFDLYGLDQQIPHLRKSMDVVYSSHVLEHIPNDVAAINEWSKFLKIGGYIILYLPDDRWYDNEANHEHIRSFTYPQFLRFFKRAFDHLEVVESGEHHGNDLYSFYIVARKNRELSSPLQNFKKKIKTRLKTIRARYFT